MRQEIGIDDYGNPDEWAKGAYHLRRETRFLVTDANICSAIASLALLLLRFDAELFVQAALFIQAAIVGFLFTARAVAHAPIHLVAGLPRGRPGSVAARMVAGAGSEVAPVAATAGSTDFAGSAVALLIALLFNLLKALSMSCGLLAGLLAHNAVDVLAAAHDAQGGGGNYAVTARLWEGLGAANDESLRLLNMQLRLNIELVDHNDERNSQQRAVWSKHLLRLDP
ncbi:hypothetical protein T492DRAFT_890573 [Pavlovales sp. CCMP2436]|nr:hypothetical protein T492DRAFT_890573 [Pavlovales sp. CCMP2436]